MMAFLWLMSCNIPGDPSLDLTNGRDAYAAAWCALYTLSSCERSRLNQCDWDGQFENESTCVEWVKFRVSQCPDGNQFFVDNDADIRDCIDALTAFDCGENAFCEDGTPTFDALECEPLASFFNTSCPLD